MAHRLALVGPVWDDPRPWLRRYGVTHVVLPAEGPGSDGRHLAGLARLDARGRVWNLWRVEAGGAEPPAGPVGH